MHNRYIFRFWGYVHRADNGCWLWLGAADAAGRGVYSVRTDGRAKTLKAYQVAWYLVRGHWATRALLHSCDNPGCCNPDHLREGTAQDNSDDMVERGRTCHGSGHYKAILTDEHARMVRGMLANGWSQEQVATHFSVHRGAIKGIHEGRTWRHADGALDAPPPPPARKGGSPGETHPKAKLTEADVRRARALVADGSSIAAAARELGKPTQAIYLAVKGLTWRHVV